MSSADFDAIVAQVVAEHPLPTSLEGFTGSALRHIETLAGRARLTPEALLALSRARSDLSAGERNLRAIADARNLAEGRAIDDDGEPPTPQEHDLDALVASFRRD